MSRTPTCGACCPSCGLHFSGVIAFDLHLGGEANGWEHHHPLDVARKDGSPAFEAVAGECRMIPPARVPVKVWRRAGTEGRVAALRAAREPNPVAPEALGAGSATGQTSGEAES